MDALERTAILELHSQLRCDRMYYTAKIVEYLRQCFLRWMHATHTYM